MAIITNRDGERFTAGKHRISGIQLIRPVRIGDEHMVFRNPPVVNPQQLVGIHIGNSIERCIRHQRVNILTVRKLVRNIHVIQDSGTDTVACCGHNIERGRTRAVGTILQIDKAVSVVFHIKLINNTSEFNFQTILLPDIVQGERGIITVESERIMRQQNSINPHTINTVTINRINDVGNVAATWRRNEGRCDTPSDIAFRVLAITTDVKTRTNRMIGGNIAQNQRITVQHRVRPTPVHTDDTDIVAVIRSDNDG